jgi:hypothetical protein
MWIVSNPTADLTTFVAGMVAGFFLGVHAAGVLSGPLVAALAFVAFVVLTRWRYSRGITGVALLRGPPSDVIEDAQSALVTLVIASATPRRGSSPYSC